MNLNPWLWLFRLAVVADLAAVYFQWDTVRFISKPLIVLSLLLYFLQQVRTSGGGAGAFKAALFFSIIGDVALLFESRDPLFFMLGLGSFLIAHLLYIMAFNGIGKTQWRLGGPGATAQARRWPWIVGVTFYLGVLLYVLLPFLGELKLPVVIYAFILCGMLLSVVHAFRSPYSRPGIICLAGALLFVVSDTLLAINKFYFGFSFSGLAIMFTYACAQYLLTTGAVQAIKYAQSGTFAVREA